jgi:DNA-binding transcriptional LysR family regulator
MTSLRTRDLIRHISLRQLQIFESVVRHGGITRAAEMLNLSQPTVSMQIRKLSETLGLPLLETVGRTTHPTPGGREVYATTVEILERIGALDDLTSQLKNTVRGELRLSVITTATYFMPHLLGAFVERYPEVEPKLTITNRAEVLERLRANADDLMIMGQVPEGIPVEAHPFTDNRLVVVAPPRHPLAGLRSIPLERLTGERFLARETGSGTRLAVDRLLQERGLTITPYLELGSSEAIKQGIMAGLGISVLSRLSLSLELASEKLVLLDVEGFPLVRRWYAVHLQEKKLSLAARTFLDYVLSESTGVLEKARIV